jgi:penicillin-binding protein 1C
MPEQQLSNLTIKQSDHSETKLFWHLDDNYIGTTTRFHQMALNPSKGFHTITVVDEQGETITRQFEILEKERE